MDRCKTVFSSNLNYEQAFEEVCSKIEEEAKQPKLIIFSADVDIFWYVAQNIKKRFPESTTIGTTTYINFSSDGYGKKGFSAMAIYSGIECVSGAVFEASRHPMNYIRHIREAVASMSDCSNTCCLEFTNAFTQGEELVLDTFNEAFNGMDIPVIGSSAGTNPGNDYTVVSLNGEIYKNTCVFVLIHNLNGKIFLYRENLYKPSKYQFTTTDVDCEERRVYEYNERPAADVLAETLGVKRDRLSDVLIKHPMGRIVKNEIFITESDKVHDDGSISYFSQIYNHSKLVLLDVDNMDKVWQKTAENIKQNIQSPSFTIAINCLSRSVLFEKENRFEEFNNIIKNNYGKFIGISGYGEQLGFMHLNQSLVLALFE